MECRICCDINKRSNLMDIFDSRISNGPMLRFYIFLATGVEIKQDDLVSKIVCDTCLKKTFTMFIFRTQAIKNDKMLKERAGQLYSPPKSIHYDPDKPMDFKKQEENLPKVIASKNIPNNDEESVSDSKQPALINKADVKPKPNKGTRGSKNSSNTSKTQASPSNLKVSNYNDNANSIGEEDKKTSINKTSKKKRIISPKENKPNKKLKVISKTDESILEKQSDKNGLEVQKYSITQKSPTKINISPQIKINSKNIEPHHSVKTLFLQHPQLELSKELLSCNFEPFIKLEKCKALSSIISSRCDFNKAKIVFGINSQQSEVSRNKEINNALTSPDKDDSMNTSLVEVANERTVYVCHICNELFSKKNFLTIHMRSHYVCNFCQLKFKNVFDLQTHLSRNCPYLYSKNDFKIVITRCDEIPYLYNKYKSAFDVYSKETKADIKAVLNEPIPNVTSDSSTSLNDSLQKQMVVSPKCISKEITSSKTEDDALPKTQLLSVPTKDKKYVNKISILENNVILNNSIQFAKTPLEQPESLLRNKRKVVHEPKNKINNAPQNMKKFRPIMPKQTDTSQNDCLLRETIKNNFLDLTKNSTMYTDRQMIRMENEAQYVKGLLNQNPAKINASTEIKTANVINKNSVKINTNYLAFKNISNEVNYHAIPIKINVKPGVDELFARIETKEDINGLNKEIDLREIKAIGIKPLGSRTYKMPILRKTLSRPDESNIIEIDDDTVVEIPVGGQVNNARTSGMPNNGFPSTPVSNTKMNQQSSDKNLANSEALKARQYPHIVVQSNCSTAQNSLPTRYIYSSNLGKLLTSFPVKTITAVSNPGTGAPIVTSVLPVQQEPFENHQGNLMHVQEPCARPSTSSARLQIRIKKPSEINQI